ncbi:MAG: GNAT family N-acetyltransferase [Deltaproteobacteria bacterium]|nr:GNAT family N-acetyltransferase [Deltaproteobacteria bacterium]
MRLQLKQCAIREWQTGDVDALVRHANDKDIWRNLRDSFPYPYTAIDAEAWIEQVRALQPPSHFAIEIDGEAAGGIGIEVRDDVFRRSAEIGYWIGRAHWNRGIASDVLRRMTQFAFDKFDICRLHASVFGWNSASTRVLEKCGYLLEGIHRRAITKDGETTDRLVYAYVVDEP